MLECVINLSAAQAPEDVGAIASVVSDSLLDLHMDPVHNRSVFSLSGPNVEQAVRKVTRAAVEKFDIREHLGVHPRIGIVDVVPFIELGTAIGRTSDKALAARNAFGQWAADELKLPCFFYGPERSLPDIRRHAFKSLEPDFGPKEPNPRAGGCCVGVRSILVAYNLWLEACDLEHARLIAGVIRSAKLRSLAFDLDGHVQVSCNLIDPWNMGPAEAFDLVAEHASIERTELVGLIPREIIQRIDQSRWSELDLSDDSTIEHQLARLGY